MATPTIRQTVSVAASGGTATVNTTSATAVNDVLVLFFGNDDGTAAAMPAPSGTAGTWTLQATGDGGSAASHTLLYTRPVTSGGAQTVTVSPITAEEVYNSTTVLIGADTATPNDGSAQGFTSLGSNSSSMTAPSVSPSNSDSLLLCGINTYANGTAGTNSFTPPTGMTEQSDFTDGTWARATVASVALTASGATGTKTFTYTGSTSWTSATIAVKGASGGTTTRPANAFVFPQLAASQGAIW